MRPGCYDIDARIRDMDINGVWASVNFPSQISGFCGSVFARCSDPDLGLAVTRAWNDWLFEAWYSPYPDRIVPMGITWLGDPQLGAEEIRRNAARGFTSVTLPEQPHRLDMPSIFSDWWDPIIQACVETDTAISLHVGSSGMAPGPADAPRLQLGATLFGQMSLGACADWVWSKYPVRYPDVKIVMSEGGIGWVAMLIDRLDNIVDRSGYGRGFDDKTGLRPSEVLRRNFWWCTIDDPSTLCTRDTIGVENIMFETDYPHGDGTWPDSQDVFGRFYGDLPTDEVAMISHENAAAVYRHPLPPKESPFAVGLRT
jgi:predicted TIM-barrel fold metal-dependent hydrolase